MAKRGRPSEQLKKETTEGRVWRVISKLEAENDFGRTVRHVARMSGCSVAAVWKTTLWKEYFKIRRSGRTQPAARVQRRRGKESIEARVWQIVRKYSSENNFGLTVQKIAEMIGCSTSAVGKTRAWEGYHDARTSDKEDAKGRLKSQRIR